MGKLCVPKEEIISLIREAHTSKVFVYFGIEKIMPNLQMYYYFSNLKVVRFFQGCILCCINNPSNRMQGPYGALPMLTRPRERKSMDFIESLEGKRR
jgi:hypothetical protein